MRYLEDHPRTCKWLATMVIVFVHLGILGPLPNGLCMANKMGVILTTYKSSDDPPSKNRGFFATVEFMRPHKAMPGYWDVPGRKLVDRWLGSMGDFTYL